MNGTNKQINRALIFALAIGGVAAVNINSASAAPGPKPIVRAAPSPTPAPAPKVPPIPALIAKPTPPPIAVPISPPPLATVTQLPSFMPWTVAPTPTPALLQLPSVNISKPPTGDATKIKLPEVATKIGIVLGLTAVGLLAVAPISTGAALFGISASISGVASTVAHTSGAAFVGNLLGIVSVVATIIAIKMNE